MWCIEIGYKYTAIISRMMYDTREEAEVERAKLLPVLGQERDWGKNSQHGPVTIVDKFGSLDVTPGDAKVIRLYNIKDWEHMVIKNNAEMEVRTLKEKA